MEGWRSKQWMHEGSDLARMWRLEDTKLWYSCTRGIDRNFACSFSFALLLQPTHRYTTVTSHTLLSDTASAFVTAACRYRYTNVTIHIHLTLSAFVTAACIYIYIPSPSIHFCLTLFLLLLLQPADTYTPFSIQTLQSDTIVTAACRYKYTTFTIHTPLILFLLLLLQPSDTQCSPSIHFCLTPFLLLLPQPADTPPSHPYTSVWHCFCFCYHSLQMHHLHIHTLLSDTVSAFATAACRYTTFTSIHFCLTPFLFLLPLPADTYTSLHGCFLGIRWTWKWDYFYSFTMHCNNLIQSGA